MNILKEIKEIKNEIKNNYEKKGHDAAWKRAIEDRVDKLEKLLVAQKTAKA